MKGFVKTCQSVAFCLLPLTCSNCESTGDPREGGIFWNEAQARERLAVKHTAVQQTQTEAAEAQATTSRLRARREAISETVARQRRELTQLGTDIAKFRAELANRSETGGQIDTDLQNVERQRVSLVRDDSQDVARMEAELERLRAEVNQLKARNRRLRETR